MSKGVGKFVAGAAVGVGIGMLLAPKSGEETRKELKAKFEELVEKVKSLKADDVKEYFECKIEEIKKDLRELDKEKVLEIAKEKGELVKDKIEELAVQAKDKATPAIEKAVGDVRTKVIEFLKETTKKLEKEGKEKKN